MRNTTGVQWAAICGAAGLLILQIIGGLEYTEGGSNYAIASMIAAMVTVALLPLFIEAARRAKAGGIAVALFVAFCAFLAYSLPATVGRTGEVREVKAVEAKVDGENRAIVQSELSGAIKSRDNAKQKAKDACNKDSKSKDCSNWKRDEKAYQVQVNRLMASAGGSSVKLGDMGSEAWAWLMAWTGISAEMIRRLSALAFGLGLDVAIWALVWFASSDKMRRVVPVAAVEVQPVTNRHQLPEPEVSTEVSNNPSDPRPRKRTTKRQARRERVIESIRRQTLAGKKPSFKLIKARHRLPNATASRWMKEAAA